jgi:hypothetical protein
MEILGHARIAVTMEILQPSSGPGPAAATPIGKLCQLLGTTSAGALLSTVAVNQLIGACCRDKNRDGL